MTTPKPLRDFALEVFFSEWEFKAKYHMTASDIESMSTVDLLAMASPQAREDYQNMWLGYTQTWGMPQLREAIAQTYDAITAQQVLCLAGAGEGLYMLAKVLLGAQDHVIVPTPNYQSAESVPLSVCEVTGVPLLRCEAKGGWRLDLEALQDAIRPNTKLLSLNFPHNPTGILPSMADLEAVIALCRARGIWILNDEVYRGVELDPADRLPQMADLYEKGISLNVMSKAYGLPGLRIGWMACKNRDLLERIERYKHYLSICNAAPAEQLALIALNAQEKILQRNHALLTRNVQALEGVFAEFPALIEWTRPLGGCTAFPRYCGPENVEVFCRQLLEESGVLLLPSSIYASQLSDTPADHFRIGFGRSSGFLAGLEAMRQHFAKFYPDYRV